MVASRKFFETREREARSRRLKIGEERIKADKDSDANSVDSDGFGFESIIATAKKQFQ